MERMYFIGVSTTDSSIIDLFPRWADTLELRAEITGVDLPVGAGQDQVRDVITRLSEDSTARGALITTHKVAVGEHAGDLFVELDEWARRCGEVSCVVKRDDGLHGSAKDPVTSWQAFMDIGGADYFARHPGAEILCLGAGGSGTAFTSQLQTIEHPPARVHVTNRSPERLAFLARVHEELGSRVETLYHRVDGAEDNARILHSLPAGSVVANATGMGKDRPGSPVSDGARFPDGGVAWDFNYRGSLEFLAQARAQQADRHLQVEDGWRYFLYGWSEHIADVFALHMDRQRFDQLAEVADELRPG